MDRLMTYVLVAVGYKQISIDLFILCDELEQHHTNCLRLVLTAGS